MTEKVGKQQEKMGKWIGDSANGFEKYLIDASMNTMNTKDVNPEICTSNKT